MELTCSVIISEQEVFGVGLRRPQSFVLAQNVTDLSASVYSIQNVTDLSASVYSSTSCISSGTTHLIARASQWHGYI